MKKILASILLLATAFSLSAHEYKGVYVRSLSTGVVNDRINIYLGKEDGSNVTIVNNSGCQHTDFVQVNETAVFHDSALSLALYAMASKSKIDVHTSNIENDCSKGQRPRVQMFRVHGN